MKFIEKLKSLFTEEDGEKVRQEKKESINNLTENNEFLNDSVNKLFDLLDD